MPREGPGSRSVRLAPSVCNCSNNAGGNHCDIVCPNCSPPLNEPCPDRHETSITRQLTCILLLQGSQDGTCPPLRLSHFLCASNLLFHTGQMMQASYQNEHQSLMNTIGHGSHLIIITMGERPCGNVLRAEGSADQTPGTVWAYIIYTNLLEGKWKDSTWDSVRESLHKCDNSALTV